MAAILFSLRIGFRTMTIRDIVKCVALFATLQTVGASETLNVHRDGTGEFTQRSEENITRLFEAIVESGPIHLWITSGVPFDSSSDLSAGERAAQRQRVEQNFYLVLGPAVADGILFYDPDRPNVEGPGRSVVVGADGFAFLIAEPRILNISYSTPSD